MLENLENNESFTTSATEKLPTVSVFKRQNFFRILRDEILKIDGLPLENSQTLEKTSFYNKIVDHLENEKLKASASPHQQQDSLVRRQEISFEGTDSRVFELDWKLPEFLGKLEEKPEKTQKNPDFQGNFRGTCRNCPRSKCESYRMSGVALGKFKETGFFSCENCDCPMSSHEILGNRPVFSIALANFLGNRQYQQNHLNFEAIVAVFFGDCNEKTQENDFFRLSEFLNYGGFAVISRKTLEFSELLAKFLEKKLYSLRNSMEKAQYETIGFLLQNPEEIARVFRENPAKSQKMFAKSKLSSKKNLIETELRGKLFDDQQFERISAAIASKLQGKAAKRCVTVLFSAKNVANFAIFRDFMQCSQSPKGFELFYASKSARTALLDCQIFFPEAFEFNFLTFLLCPPLKLVDKVDKSLSAQDSRKLLRKAQDCFKDEVLYNEFSLINSKESEQFVSAEDFLLKGGPTFAKFSSNHGALISFFNSDEGAVLNVCGKFGSSAWTQLRADFAANYLRFTESFHNQCIFKGFFPKLANYQRVFVVFRPALLHSDLDELVLNVFRINDFTIIKRDFVKLTREQAYYLAKVEKIPEESLDNYLKFMLNGPVQLVLLSNFAAFALANVILRGCGAKNAGKDVFLKAKDFVLRQSSGQSQEVLIKHYENPHENSKKLCPFSGVQQLLDPTQLILEEGGGAKPSVYQEKVWISAGSSTTNSSAFEAKNFSANAPIRADSALNFRKDYLLKELAQDSFNYFAFCAEDEAITEELTSLLLPDCSTLSIIQVIIKPNARAFANDVVSTFTEMGFQVPYRRKLMLSEHEAENFLFSLNEDAKSAMKLLNYWISEEIEVLSLVKMACRKEILSLLRSFSLESAHFPEKLPPGPLSKQLLAKALVPCWTNSSFFWSLGLIDPCLRDFSWGSISELASFQDFRNEIDPSLDIYSQNYDYSSNAVKFVDKVERNPKKTQENSENPYKTTSFPAFGESLLVKNRSLIHILEFILLNCFADCLQEKSPVEALIFEGAISEDTAKHVNFKVKARRLGEFEVRLRKIEREFAASELSLAEFQYKMIGWYYSLVNRSFPQRTPVSYHYKIHTDSSNIQVFDCQQFVGLDFFREILRQMLVYEEKLHKKPQINRSFVDSPSNSKSFSHSRNNSQLSPSKMSSKYSTLSRGNIVAYLWGSKLAKFVKSLEKITEKIEGFGEIRLDSQRKLAGVWTKDQLFTQEKELFQGILGKLSENLDDLYDVENFNLVRKPEEKAKLLQRISELHARISTNLATILQSESYKYLRKAENLRIFPQTLEPETLRIFCDREQILEILLHGEFETLDFYHEINRESSKKSAETLHYNDFCLVNIRPAIKSKYFLVAMVYYLLENPEILSERLRNQDPNALETLSDGIQDGFRKTYWLDHGDLEFLQQMHKDAVVQASFVRKRVPDLIKLELFFYSLEQIDRNLRFLHEIKQKIADSQQEKLRKFDEIQRKLAIASRDTVKELNQRKKLLEKEFDKNFEAMVGQLKSQTGKCRDLFEKLANSSIFYNFEELLLREDENFTANAKVKVPQRKYFLPLLEENWENDLENERFRKDLNEVFLYKEHGFEKYQGAVFYCNIDNDPLQQTWVQKRPFMVRNLREVHREEKDGVLVEKIRPNAEKMLQNAIDKEIAKFKEVQKGFSNTQGAETGDSRSNTYSNPLSKTERETRRELK